MIGIIRNKRALPSAIQEMFRRKKLPYEYVLALQKEAIYSQGLLKKHFPVEQGLEYQTDRLAALYFVANVLFGQYIPSCGEIRENFVKQAKGLKESPEDKDLQMIFREWIISNSLREE